MISGCNKSEELSMEAYEKFIKNESKVSFDSFMPKDDMEEALYKDIFNEALISIITPDEVLKMISEKEDKLGATVEIKEGKEVIWKTLSGKMFSNYVGR